MSEEKESKKEETVEMKKTKFNDLMAKMKDLENNQDMLMQVADKKQVAKFMQENKEEQPIIMDLAKIDGRVITSWKTEKNRVWKDDSGHWHEDQQIKIFFEDGKDLLISYKDFVSRYETFPCKRKGVEHDEENNKIYYELESLDESGETYGDTYKVENKFVNP